MEQGLTTVLRQPSPATQDACTLTASEPSGRGRHAVSSTRFVMLCALILVAAYNFPAWHALQGLLALNGLGSALFYLSFAVLLWSVFTLLLTLVSFKYTLKPVLSVLALLSAGAVFFMTDYGVSIDHVMIQNLFETDLGEAGDLLSPALIAYFLFLGVLPIVLLWRQPIMYAPVWLGLRHKLLISGACLVIAASMLGGFYSIYAPLFREHPVIRHLINPTNYLYGLQKYAQERWGHKESLLVTPIGLDAIRTSTAVTNGRKSLIVFVVGETARADHFGINGYERDTTPEMSKLGVLSLREVTSCGTSTSVSVPCMFSMFGREAYSDRKAKTHEGLLDVLQRAGISVYWKENNSDCKGTCLRVPNETVKTGDGRAHCSQEGCHDEALLENLQQIIDGKENDLFIVLHTMGSHGPAYYKRYPADFERFTPVCKTKQLNACPTEALINAYDNSIAYTDYFLAQVVKLLESNSAKRDTAMVYVSDHGESLGEKGLYLHAAPYALAPREQTHVPMLMWFSQSARNNWGIDEGCLRAKQNDAFSHDNIFHSFLGLFEVGSSVYQSQLDLFHSCKSSVLARATRRPPG